MKLKVGRLGLQIIPESEEDEAYIVDTLQLRSQNDAIPLQRIASMGLPLSIAYLEAKKLDVKVQKLPQTIKAIIGLFNTIDELDPQEAHSVADKLLLQVIRDFVSAEIVDAYQRAQVRFHW